MKVVNPFVIPTPDVNEYRERLAEGLKKAKARRLHIYRTYMVVGNRREEFVFTTTAKEIHLELGRMDILDQQNLAMFLKHEFNFNGTSQILVRFREENQDHGSGVLVTMTKEQGATNFTLSSAR